MLLATFAWRYTTNDIGAIFNGIFGIESCLVHCLSQSSSRAEILMSRIRTALPVNPTRRRLVPKLSVRRNESIP